MRPALSRAVAACLVALAGSLSPADAQGDVHPTLRGGALLEALDGSFSPTATLPYDRARDSLFALSARLSPSGDSIRALYTDHAVFLPAGADPTQAACDGDRDGAPSTCHGPRNLNAEHVWPQSYGTRTGDARSDGHHLFPARADVNSTRGNRPFGTVTDAQADRWWRRASTQHTPPASPAEWTRIDLDGPGVDGDRFAPRDDRRGDVARAVFYVRAVYPDRLDGTALTWFEGQVATLLAWHAADPSSDAERRRSDAVARWQGTPNPFVLDATLAERALGGAATLSETAPPSAALALGPPRPNPVRGGEVRFALSVPPALGSSPVRATVFDALGRAVALGASTTDGATLRVETARLPVGAYALRVVVPGAPPLVRRFTVAAAPR